LLFPSKTKFFLSTEILCDSDLALIPQFGGDGATRLSSPKSPPSKGNFGWA
jgi:hypothetical protein